MTAAWIPLPYMERAASFLVRNQSGGLPLEPGGRKTSITLEAFRQLYDAGKAKKMLVIAPKRVALNTWPDEIRKWSCFSHLRFAHIMGDKKKRLKALTTPAEIYLTNPEEIDWICKQYPEGYLPFDIIAIDELTRFKNTQSKRFKALKAKIGQARRWGLTGSLTSNGYLDVFGQQLLLDGGQALGRFITRYREKYFTNDYTGFVWTIKPGADKQIAKAIEPYWFAVDPAEYQQLPELVDDPRVVRFDDKTKKLYETLERDYLVALEDENIAAPNAAACYTKLAQLANGAVYTDDGDGTYTHVHDLKLEALDDLAEELDGAPLLIGYEFRHDLERIAAKLKPRLEAAGLAELPSLGGGHSEKKEATFIELWNKGELPFLAAHPKSAGHGLNLQEANACHVCWFSLPWSWEDYDQFIRRIRRNGNEAQRVFNHILRVPDTLDDIKLTSLAQKCTNYGTFMGYIRKLATGESIMSETTGLPPGWTTPVKIGEAPPVTQAENNNKAQRQRIADAVTAYERPKAELPPAEFTPHAVQPPTQIVHTIPGEVPHGQHAAPTQAFPEKVPTERVVIRQDAELTNHAERKGHALAAKLEAQARELLAIADALRFG